MYLEHFGLSEAPFRITPHTDFFFGGGNRGATLDALLYAITHDEGIVKVSGEVGSGKTMLCRVLMERLPATVTIIYLANPSLSREDILYAIADELRLPLPPDARAAMVLRALQEHLINSYGEGRQVVVLIDEAHAMPAETLEEIRLLSNLESNRNKLLQLVLFGQPELNDVLARPDMRQLKERITHNFSLEPLVRDDIASYLDFRMRAAGYRGPNVFGELAIQNIAKVSQGLTRRINILADKCLLAAYSSASHQIGLPEVQAAIKDSDFSQATLPKPGWFTLKTFGIGAALFGASVAGAVLATLYQSAGDGAATSTKPPVVNGSFQQSGTISPPAPATQAAQGEVTSTVSAKLAETTPAVPAAAAMPTTAVATEPANSNKSELKETPPATMTEASQSTQKAGPLTLNGIQLGKSWLADAPANGWFLQLLVSDGDRPTAIETFLKNTKAAGIDMNKVRVYQAEINGARRLGVIYGDFESRSAAAMAVRSLPGAVRVGRPYPRQVAQLR